MLLCRHVRVVNFLEFYGRQVRISDRQVMESLTTNCVTIHSSAIGGCN